MCPKNDDEEEVQIYSTIQEFETHLPHTVEILKTPQLDKVYIIGTAHFSRKSHTDVSYVIRNVKPDGLVLELCPLRLHILQFDEETLIKEAQDLNALKIIQMFREHGVINGLFYLSFLRTNANITKQLELAPGGECRRAVAEASRIPKCKIFLGDRPLKITIGRALSGLTFKQKMEISMAMNAKPVQKWKITTEHIEKFKHRDSEMLEEMKIHAPFIYEAFVSERDYILAHSMTIAVEKCRISNKLPATIVGIIGMGHMNGVVNNFGKTNAKIVKQLMTVPTTNQKVDGHSKEFPNNPSTSLVVSCGSNIIASLKYLINLRKYWGKFK